MHYFQNPFNPQSQQIARLDVGCLLAQGLVVGGSRDLQRQKLRFPFAVPLSPCSLCHGRASVWAGLVGSRPRAAKALQGLAPAGWPGHRQQGGLSLATSSDSFFLMWFRCFSCCLCSLLWPYGV